MTAVFKMLLRKIKFLVAWKFAYPTVSPRPTPVAIRSPEIKTVKKLFIPLIAEWAAN
jgi:hypothetical protein